MKQTFEIVRLIGEYLHTHIIDPKLERWLKESPRHQTLFDEVAASPDLLERLDSYEAFDMEAEWKVWKRKQEIHTQPAKRISLRSPILWKVAAVAAVVAILFVYKAFTPSHSSPAEMEYVWAEGDAYQPGTTCATLSMGDSLIQLGNHTTLAVAAKGLQLTDSAGTHLLVNQYSAGTAAAPYILKIPKGGEHAITLADGTRVWLNSDSELRFPKQFASHERRIALQGEAYMEVHKSLTCPFYVETAGGVVHVTGTSFNISTYADEPSTVVTLVEGNVKIEKTDGTVLTELLPSQQYEAAHQGNQFSVRQVDVNKAIAWHQGLFVFEDESLASIAQKLSRWYNIIIEVDSELADRRYSGELDRYVTLESWLKILRGTGELEVVEPSDRTLRIMASPL